MAPKRKNPPPPPPQTHSSEDDSSSGEDEEQYVAQPVATQAKPPKPTEQDDDDESESDTGTESETEQPVRPVRSVVPPPSESEDSSEEEEEEEDEEENKKKAEKLKSPVKASETEPEKKKLKLSEQEQSPSKKSASGAPRVWSQDDEIVLLGALSAYHSKNGKLPPIKDYGSFLSTISGSIGFPVTEKQLSNKIRLLRHNFGQNKKKGTKVKGMKPHENTVFEMCTKLFQDDTKASKKEVLPESSTKLSQDDTKASKKEVLPESSTKLFQDETKASKKKVLPESSTKLSQDDTKASKKEVLPESSTKLFQNDTKASKKKVLRESNSGDSESADLAAGVVDANGGLGNGAALTRSYVHLRSLIKDMISGKQCESWFTVEDVIARIGESKAQSLEQKTKMLNIDAVKLRARENKVKAEVFGFLADGMTDE